MGPAVAAAVALPPLCFVAGAVYVRGFFVFVLRGRVFALLGCFAALRFWLACFCSPLWSSPLVFPPPAFLALLALLALPFARFACFAFSPLSSAFPSCHSASVEVAR